MADTKKTKRIKSSVIIGIVIVSIAASGIFIFKNLTTIEVRDYPQIKESGVIRIVTSLDPIGYYADSDSISGYTNDILNYIKKSTDLNIEISLENNIQKCFDGLKSGKYDIIARNIAINNNLKKEFSFTSPIIYNKLVLIQRKAEYNNDQEPIRNRLELANKTLYIPADSPNKTRIENLATEIGDSIYIEENQLYSINELAMLVASGEIDYAVCDIKAATKLSESMPELDVKTDIGFTHLEGWSVRKNAPILLDSLNSWLDNLKSSKEYDKIMKKYFN